MQFDLSQSRVRSGYSNNKLAIVRHVVISPMRLNTARKVSLTLKRVFAETTDEARAEALAVMT